VVTRAAKMAVIGAAYLLAVSRAFARIHIEHNALWWSPPAHLIDPLAKKIGERGKVLGPAQPLRLKAPHMTGRGGRAADRPIANHPAHCRVTTQPVGIIHVFVSSQPPEH
jgi:hypothetical protein